MFAATPHPEWLNDMLTFLEPYHAQVISSRIFEDATKGRLSERLSQEASINFYPLIESFPQFLALNLAKVPGGNSDGGRQTRCWLIKNIQQERLHARWWRQMADKFGVPAEIFDGEISPPPEIDAINNYLWRICTHGSLAEGIAAANFAVEGPTGTWTKKVKKGFAKHPYIGKIEVTKPALEWIDAHASYDDMHPIEALEIIKLYAKTEGDQLRVRLAAKRSLEYYALALEACYRLFG
jgi:pyrroloquinoline quinone (PQQ) biosynthesis protein C